MSAMEPTHESVREYIAARKAGDSKTTARIVQEVMDRFNSRTTDGSEGAELLEASLTIPFGGQ